MVRNISHTIEIDAAPEAVWKELADTGSYADWNPFVHQIDGPLEKSARLEVKIEPPGGRRMTFKPKVLAARPGRELRWLGHLLVPGLFDGEHSFEIEPLADGRSQFTQAERFSGLLVRPFGSTLERTRRGFEDMNRALKACVEG